MHRLLLIASLFAACQPNAAPEEFVLKAYDVPEAQTAELSSIITDLMHKKDGDKWTRVGSARVSPDGRQVLVAAPKSLHVGLTNWIEQMRTSPVPPPRSIRLEYWIVRGSPAAERKHEKALDPIKDALDALVTQYGPQDLTFVDRVSITGRSGEKVQNQSSQVEVVHQAIARGEVVDAEIELRGKGGSNVNLRARLNVPVGKLVVIGDAQSLDNRTQYFIVRATLL